MEQATTLYEQALANGSATAACNLGINSWSSDPKRSVEYFEAAAQREYGLAFFHLSRAYRAGHGVPQSDSQSIFYLYKGADRGCLSCQNQLGRAYSDEAWSLGRHLAFESMPLSVVLFCHTRARHSPLPAYVWLHIFQFLTRDSWSWLLPHRTPY